MKQMRLATDYTAREENESTCFRNTLGYTTIVFRAFSYVPGKKRTLCGQCEKKDSRNIGRAVNAQEMIVQQRARSSTVADTGYSTKTLDVRDKNHAKC